MFIQWPRAETVVAEDQAQYLLSANERNYHRIALGNLQSSHSKVRLVKAGRISRISALGAMKQYY